MNMGPKMKKPLKNAFSFFLEDYVQNERRKGRSVSYRIAAEECAIAWKELPEEEKEKYNKMAAVNKQYSKLDKEKKFTTLGVSFAEIERQQNELKEKTDKADAEIKTTIWNLNFDTLKTHLFYIVHCNYYCKTEEGIFVPGELAIVEFSLQSGIRRTFHTLINPGPIPLGYAYEAKNTIETVHGLPYPPYDEGDSDYFGILDKVLHFLKPGKLPDGRNPPLYCIENNVSASENILKSLSENSSEEDDFFRVYFLHKMFFWLKNKCVENIHEENVGFPVIANAESEITKDMFCYVPGISCSFHTASEDKYQNCSLSVVQRFVYVICDHCCQYVGVTLVPGQHCRLKTDLDRKPDSRFRAEKQKKKRSSPTLSEEFEYDGQSSYAGDFSVRGGRGGAGEGACSFLHEELESKFESFDVSSVASGSTRRTVSTMRTRGPMGIRIEPDSDDEDDFIKVVSLGRGTSRR